MDYGLEKMERFLGLVGTPKQHNKKEMSIVQ
jgi:hypothetical protein